MATHRDITTLVSDDKEITLVGTAHVSKESVELVQRVIADVSPETVCIELCESRYQSLVQRTQWQNTDLIKAIRDKKAFLLLLNLLMAHYQKKIGRQLGIHPGEEMLRALQAAEAVGAEVHLVDRDIRTTLTRTWRLMGWRTRIKLLAQLVAAMGDSSTLRKEDIERLKRSDVLDALLTEMGTALPEVRRVLIDERDQYLSHRIRNAPGKRIVAVIGAGHVPGVRKHWGKPVDLAELDNIPTRGWLSNSLKWALPAAAVGLVILGFSLAGAKAGAAMLKWWVLANAVLAGLGAAAALGHPLTILSAVVASPLTSLNPMIAAGWVAGLVEILLGRPKVRDFEQLPEDISSVGGFWKNRITRILLVVVFTNLGSSLGTFVAIPLMARVFA